MARRRGIPRGFDGYVWALASVLFLIAGVLGLLDRALASSAVYFALGALLAGPAGGIFAVFRLVVLLALVVAIVLMVIVILRDLIGAI